MAVRSPAPQVDDPELLAALSRELPVRGNLGELFVSDIVSPVVALPGPRGIPVRPYSISQADVFAGVAIIAPAAGAVLADTGPLPAGFYSCIFTAYSDEAVLNVAYIVRHMDAVPATVISLFQGLANGQGLVRFPDITYFLPEGHSLRILTFNASSVGSRFNATVVARRSA